MKIKTLILLLAVLFCAAFPAVKCNKNNEPILTVYSNVQERTNGGALVASQSGVSDELKRAIDEELTRLFADVAPLRYTTMLSHSDYIIYVLPNCALSPESRTRSFLIRADSYDGTIYDQDPRPGVGKIYAAEYVITNGRGDISNSYVVCNAPTADADFRNAIRYGPEHILAYFNDRAYYEFTKFHGNGVNHPLYLPTDRAQRETPKPDVIDYGGRVRILKR